MNDLMRKVRIAELKAHLSAHLKAVRKGATVTVMDRDTPIARIVPYREQAATRLRVRAPLRKLHSTPLPPPLSVPVDSLSALLEERRDRR
jgi:prevent-host-death family protein